MMFGAKRNARPFRATRTNVPSGGMVNVPGPEALKVTDLPVSTFVVVTKNTPLTSRT